MAPLKQLPLSLPNATKHTYEQRGHLETAQSNAQKQTEIASDMSFSVCITINKHPTILVGLHLYS